MLVEHRDFYYASYFINSLEKMLNYQDMFARIVLNFLKKVMNYIENGKVDLSDIEAYINLIERLDNPTLVMFLRTNLEQIVNNQ